jgi:hypothetical protein
VGDITMVKMSRDEMTEVLFGKVHKINLENKDEGEPCYTLPEMLARKNITTLRKQAKLHQIKGYSKMSKEDIIPAITAKLTNEDNLIAMLFLLNDIEWNFFKRAAKTKEIVDNKLLSNSYFLLMEMGILYLYYTDGRFHFVIPEEIRQAYTEVGKTGFPEEKEHANNLNNYAIAATNLYGVISQEDFVEIFNKQNKRKTDIDEMFSILMHFVHMDCGYCFWEEYIVNDEFADNDFNDVDDLVMVAAAKPRYLPPKKAFLKYSDWDYIEITPQLTALSQHITQEITDDPDDVIALVDEIVYCCRHEEPMKDILEMFTEMGFVLKSFEHAQTLAQLLMDVQNNTRLWLNNGHTPSELFQEEKKHLKPLPKEPMRIDSPGRNDPCPCGSGKKYKKCCGRLLS